MLSYLLGSNQLKPKDKFKVEHTCGTCARLTISPARGWRNGRVVTICRITGSVVSPSQGACYLYRTG